LSVEEVTAWLKAVEDDGGLAGNRDGRDKLYLTEKERLERYKQKEPEGSRRGGGSNGRGKGHGGKNKSNTISDSGGDQSRLLGTRGKDKCRSCDKIGHWARECRSHPKREEQAHVVRDDEPTMMLAQTKTFSSPNVSQPPAVVVAQLWPLVTSLVSKRCVELVEEEV
jgi:hypothetical protein